MTFTEFQSNCDAGDSIAFLGYYLSSFLGAFIVVFIPVAILFMKGDSTRKYIMPLIISAICCWGIYFISNVSRYMTLALLGSESSSAAEFAYQKSFKPNLHEAIKLATSNVPIGQEEVGGQNVRFYAACRIADILASSNQDFGNTILDQVQSALIVAPGFIGTNAINDIFYIQNREQPRLQVSEIIERRLEFDRSYSNGHASLTKQ